MKIWKILSLSILQNIRRCTLERAPRVWLDNQLLKRLGI